MLVAWLIKYSEKFTFTFLQKAWLVTQVCDISAFEMFYVVLVVYAAGKQTRSRGEVDIVRTSSLSAFIIINYWIIFNKIWYWSLQ
jgi:hypothetical protein